MSPKYAGITKASRRKAGRTCLRVGSVAIRDPLSTRRELADMRYGETLDEPAYFWPLLVSFDKEFKNVKFSRTHAYEMEDFCVGDIEENKKWNQLPFTSDYRFGGVFTHVHWKSENKSDFIRRLKQHVAEEGECSVGSGLPVKPSYSTRKFSPKQYKHLGLAKWPKLDVDIAVRIVDHYSAMKISYPWDIRLAVVEEDTIDTVKSDICEKINLQGTEDGEPVNSRQLFTRRQRDQWEMVLWVLPQTASKSKTKKMFEWHEGGILQFLNNTDRVRTVDKKLYVEAHIVAKKEE